MANGPYAYDSVMIAHAAYFEWMDKIDKDRIAAAQNASENAQQSQDGKEED